MNKIKEKKNLTCFMIDSNYNLMKLNKIKKWN